MSLEFIFALVVTVAVGILLVNVFKMFQEPTYLLSRPGKEIYIAAPPLEHWERMHAFSCY